MFTKNETTSRSGKLIRPAVDEIVARIFALPAAGFDDLQGWAVGGLKAYRQTPIHPDERKYAVVAALVREDVEHHLAGRQRAGRQ